MVAQAHHAISYIELGVTDLDEARAFYEVAPCKPREERRDIR